VPWWFLKSSNKATLSWEWEQMAEHAIRAASGSDTKITRLFESEAHGKDVATRRVVYVDSRPVLRETMNHWLSISLSDYEVKSVDDVDAVLSALESCSEVVLILYNIGGHRTERSRLIRTLTLLASNAQKVPVAVLADTDEAATVMTTLECGVRGYIPTDLSAAVMIEAMHLVCAGDIYAPMSTMMRQMMQHKRHIASGHTLCGKDSLSPRQLQIVECLRRGMANKQIAFELNMSQGTVKVHLRSMMKKLSVSNRTQVVLAMMSSDDNKM
jgi:DNA-binding NarL/FixJ family response regulator